MDKEEVGAVPAKSSPTKSTSSISSSRTQTDDESITTSTESEAFDETWTLVTDKNNQVKVAKEALTAEQRIEILNKSKTKTKEIQKEKHGSLDKDKGIAETEAEEDDNAECEGEGEGGPEGEADENIDSDKEHYGRKSDHDNTADDELSDGISIISESESAGRITPNISGDRLTNLNLKMALGENFIEEEIPRTKLNFPIKLASSGAQPLVDETDSQSQLIQRRRRRSGSHSSSTDKNKKSLKSVNDITHFNNLPDIVKKGLSGLFYAGLTLFILSFLGKIKMMFIENCPKETQNLEQKLNDIELQNNLMRAEIDLLTKQVKYLNNVRQPKYKPEFDKAPYQGYQSKDMKIKEKPNSFQAWTGHDDTLQPIEITKKDLKKPYKCEDGRFVEIAGMCVENTPRNEEVVIDPVTNILNELFDKSGNLKDFVDLTENIDSVAENPFEPLTDVKNDNSQSNGQKPPLQRQKHIISSFEPENSNKYTAKKKVPDGHNQWKDKEKYKIWDDSNEFLQEEEKPKYDPNKAKDLLKPNFKSNEHFHDENESGSKENFYKDNSNERFNKNKHRGNFRNDNSKERFNSKEQHHHRKNNKHHSKERSDRKNSRYPSNNSKERYDSKENHRPKLNSGENRKNFKKDLDWHEQYMNHREQARQQRDANQQNNNNWYIERGGGREQLRYQ